MPEAHAGHRRATATTGRRSRRRSRARGLGDRVDLHGHVDEEEKARLLARAWVALTASSAEGWCLTVMEAGACGTPSAALRVGGLRGVDRRRRDRPAGRRRPRSSSAACASSSRDPALRARSGDGGARAGARLHLGRHGARDARRCMDAADGGRAAAAARRAARARRRARPPGWPRPRWPTTRSSCVFTVVFARLLGATGYGSLAALVSTFLILLVAGPVAAGRGRARGGARTASATRSVLRATLRAWTQRLLVGARRA